MPTPLRGIEALLEVLHAGGVRYIFGNPGTTELPFNDALASDPRFEYILALQEVPLVAMADGYALASGKLGVACVHIACGLGTAMGMLYNAHIEGSPLMLIAGQQDRRLRLGEPVLEGDLVSVVRPWTKWAVEVQRVEDVPSAVRRAAQIAQTPPTGPVFLSLPVDVQMEAAGDVDLSGPSIPDRRVRPPMEALSRAANVLAQAQRPAILAGSRVTECGGCEALAEVAERLGAPIYAECATSHGRLPVSAAHPLYAGTLPLWIPDVRKILEQHDVVFVAGMNFLRLYLHHKPGNPVPPGVRIIHLDCNPGEIGKNYPVEIGLVGDLHAGLAELAGLVESRLDETRKRASDAVIEQGAQRRREMQSQLWAEIDSQRDMTPMSPLTLMGTLARALPAGTAVVDEAVTTNQNVFERTGVMVDPTLHIAHRGWALGWGLGCALGVKLA
ncbi:MAG TPA: thiamine pyrophosphate-binding protein, partial [Planctomycetaceae bacterium]|nr:thiamine pyrophosphate-binding protein [Planctomycetaceae bacterium]